MSLSKIIISSTFAIIWLASLYFDVSRQPRLGHHWYIYKLVMLTNLNFVLDTIYSVLVLVGVRSVKVRNVVDFMYFTSIFPVGIVTCILFWGLYAIEPELVMPDWIAKLIPQWLNHVTHTLPIVFILTDACLYERKAPKKLTCLIMSATLVLVYFMIIGYVRFYDGYWLYPLLTFFAVEHFVISYFLASFAFYGLTRAACFLNTFLHKSNVSSVKATKSKNR